MDMKAAVSESDRVRKSREEWASTSTVNFRDWICGTGQFSEENLRRLRDEFFTDMGKRLYERMKAAMDAAFADHDAVPAAKANSCEDCRPQAAAELGNLGAASNAGGAGNKPEPVAWAVFVDPLEPTLCSNEKDARTLASHYACEVQPLYEKPQPMLTDEEKEAISIAVGYIETKAPPGGIAPIITATLRALRNRS